MEILIVSQYFWPENFKIISHSGLFGEEIVLVINNPDVFNKISKKYKNNKIKILNKFSQIPSNIKFDITISAIVGIAGLEPTIQFTKVSKKNRI